VLVLECFQECAFLVATFRKPRIAVFGNVRHLSLEWPSRPSGAL